MSKHSRKRKCQDEDSEKDIRKRIRKLEKKLKRRRMRSSSSSDSVSDDSRSAPSHTDVNVPALESDSELLAHPDPILITDDQNTENSVANCNQTTLTNGTVVNEPSSSAGVFPEAQNTQTLTQSNTVPDTTPPENTSSEPTVPELDKDILDLLGETPSKEKKYGPNIKNELATRWTHILTIGLTKEMRKELTDKYLTPDNCKNIDAPILNPETKAALSETLVKKDKAIENKQKQRATALSCLGVALTRLLDLGHKEPSVLRPLLDAARLVCDIQHTDSLIRRSFICSTLKKEVKDQLYATEIDKYLFSEKLADTLKAAKAIYKSGTEMKVPPPKQKKPTTSNRNLNSKPPLSSSRPAGVSRKQEPAAETSRRHQIAHSSTEHAPARSRPRSQVPNQRRR